MNAINGQVQSLTLRGQIARVDGLIDAVNTATREMAALRDEMIAEVPAEYSTSAGRINSTTGEVESSTTSVWAEIDVSGARSVRFRTAVYSGTYGYVWLDGGKAYISGVRTTKAEEVEKDVPEGARYLRLSWNPSTVTQDIGKDINVVTLVPGKLDAEVFDNAFNQSGVITGVKYRTDCYVAVNGTTAQIVKLSTGKAATAVIPAYPGASYTVSATGANRFRIAFADEVYGGKTITDCEYVYLGADSTAPRSYSRSFVNANRRKYLYVFLSNTGLQPDLTVEYTVNESGIAIDNSDKIETLTGGLAVNEDRDLTVLRRAYVPYIPYHYDGTVVPFLETAQGRNDANGLQTMYGLFDELKAQYPRNVFMSEIEYNGRILDAAPTASTDGDDYEIVLVKTGVTGEYKQYIKMPDGWTRMYTWTDANGRTLDTAPKTSTEGTVGETVLVKTDTERVYDRYTLRSVGNWVKIDTWTDTDGTQEMDTVKMSVRQRVYEIVPFEGCDYEAYALVNGIHAQETGSDIGTYYSVKAMLEAMGTATELGAVMATHRIIVMPVANPSQMLKMTRDNGYVDKSHGFSENCVNMNRDFSLYWQKKGEAYDRTGNVPFYDPYSRMLRDWLHGLTGVRYLISKHDAGAYGDRSDLGYVRDTHIVGNAITQKILRQAGEDGRLRNQWIRESFRHDSGKSWEPDKKQMLSVHGDTKLTSGGVVDAYVSYVVGIHAVLFESAPITNTSVFNGGGHRPEMVRLIAEFINDLLIGVNKNIANIEAGVENFHTYPVWPEV